MRLTSLASIVEPSVFLLPARNEVEEELWKLFMGVVWRGKFDWSRTWARYTVLRI